jgi:DNA invertase Pin-like site-specific DNA recombinase
MQTAFSYVRFSHPDQRKGDSLRRQTEAADIYAKKRGMTLNHSLKPDLGISAYRGRNRKVGNLAAFLRKVETGEVPPGSALILESLDRLSREELEESFDLLRSIVRSGIEVHTISDGRVFRKGEMNAEQMIMSIFSLARSNEESKRKSERCAQAAMQQRVEARTGHTISSRLPGWLKGSKGRKIEVVPRHAKTVRRIFELAAEGVGSRRIFDTITRENLPPWTLKGEGKWSESYIGLLLRSRHVLGEYQPGTHPRGGVWTPEGDPIPDYFPRVIEDDLWLKVQNKRAKNFAHGKIPVGKYHGNGGHSNWKNLFLSILYDNEGETMIYKQVEHRWVYLISSNRKKFKTHKLHYEPFKTAILRLLSDLDWQALVNSSNPALKTALDEIDGLIALNEDKLRRYGRLLEVDDEAPELLLRKIKNAEKESKELKSRRRGIESQRNDAEAMSDGPLVLNVDHSAKESALQLRYEIRRRVERIELTFNAKVLGDVVPPGKHTTMAKILFTNGAVKWAVLQDDNAVLLS